MQNLRDVGGTTVKKLAGGFRAQLDWQEEVRVEIDLRGTHQGDSAVLGHAMDGRPAQWSQCFRVSLSYAQETRHMLVFFSARGAPVAETHNGHTRGPQRIC